MDPNIIRLAKQIQDSYSNEDIADLVELLLQAPQKRIILEKQATVAHGYYQTSAATCPMCGKRL